MNHLIKEELKNGDLFELKEFSGTAIGLFVVMEIVHSEQRVDLYNISEAKYDCSWALYREYVLRNTNVRHSSWTRIWNLL